MKNELACFFSVYEILVASGNYLFDEEDEMWLIYSNADYFVVNFIISSLLHAKKCNYDVSNEKQCRARLVNSDDLK